MNFAELAGANAKLETPKNWVARARDWEACWLVFWVVGLGPRKSRDAMCYFVAAGSRHQPPAFTDFAGRATQFKRNELSMA